MKKTTGFFGSIGIGLAIALLLSGCGGGSGTNSDAAGLDDNGKPIQYISFVDFRQHYRVGETFSTAGNEVLIRYTDFTRIYIASGFTVEWSVEPVITDWENRNNIIVAWIDDNAAWKPIRHGDILPISPPVEFPQLSGEFYVRADYKGLKSEISFVKVYR